ncbi:hypothetical protein QYE76_056066 [Lolium multiflorum]|uniref:Uncharacterized protein n=1 Tax=Lolium multiflorum TaxID=4521 RepID=A0AAD8T1I3_LOLMU|nr:hypothetical protein QYE76_056066 [Lolium multiflorum]
MLVYEFMHNNSLDTFIFDEEKRKLLEWKNRFEIILGIARGLLYLHEDSRVRIIHRDMKASNVLLDKNMIPKISDFGIARMFGGDQTTQHTMKVIGTYGYMSPEYAMDGVFSMKSDIYSFGVLVIEIITGKRNRGFYDDELDLNLLGYAWMLWKEGRGVDLLDEAMGGTFDYTVVLRCIQIMASPSINFNQFLEKEKLKSNGSNFTDWFRHVRIFLNGGNLQYVLEAPLGPPPPPAVSEEEKNVFENRAKVYSQVQCAILCSLEAELQKRFEHHDPCEMIRELKVIFETHAAVESYEASKQFFGCMMEEGSSVSEHVFAMSGHARKLSDLGIVIPNQLGIHRVLQSLPPSYKNFVMNYNMQNMNKELPELFSMLKSAEVEIQKEHQVLMVNKTTSFKKQGKPKKGNFKKGGKKAAAPPEKPKGGPKPDTDCYYCNGKGHWKRNCPKYLADLKSGLVKKKKEPSASGENYSLLIMGDSSGDEDGGGVDGDDSGGNSPNPTKEIFSELDEINAQGLIFPRSFQKTGGDTKWGDEAPTPQGRAARVGPGAAYGVGPSSPLLPFRLLKASVAKT